MLPAIASGTKLSSLPAPGHRLSSRASWPCEAQLLKSRPSTFEVYRVLIPGYELRSFLARHSSRTSLPQSYQERTPPLALLRLPASSRPSVSLRTRGKLSSPEHAWPCTPPAHRSRLSSRSALFYYAVCHHQRKAVSFCEKTKILVLVKNARLLPSIHPKD